MLHIKHMSDWPLSFPCTFALAAVLLQVKQNEALLIPSGWFYASVAPEDCISVCCFFWHPYALGDIARTQHLQVCSESVLVKY